MIGIYKIENKVNGKVYIGQSINVEKRWETHKSELKNNHHYNLHLQRSWNKYGEENFKFEVVEICYASELNEKEFYWIEKYNSYVYSINSNGYNQTIGGDGVRQDTSVMQFDLYGNFIASYSSYEEAENVTGVFSQLICGCCLKHHKYAGRYIWIKKSEYIDKNSIEWNLNHKMLNRVEQYDLNGNYIKTWSHPREVIKVLKKNPSNCLNHKCYTCGGYIFKYENDSMEINEDYLYLANNSLKLVNCKPFYQVDGDGKIIKKYMTLKEAVDDGWNERMVNECCRELRKSYNNYLWIYEDLYEEYTPLICKELLKKENTPKRYLVHRYDINGELKKIYDGNKALKQDGFNPTNVHDCCMGRKPQYKGYIWKRYEKMN